MWKLILKDSIGTILNYGLRTSKIARAIEVSQSTMQRWASGKILLNGKRMTVKRTGIEGKGYYIITVKDAIDFFTDTKYEKAFKLNVVKLLEGKFI